MGRGHKWILRNWSRSRPSNKSRNWKEIWRRKESSPPKIRRRNEKEGGRNEDERTRDGRAKERNGNFQRNGALGIAGKIKRTNEKRIWRKTLITWEINWRHWKELR